MIIREKEVNMASCRAKEENMVSSMTPIRALQYALQILTVVMAGAVMRIILMMIIREKEVNMASCRAKEENMVSTFGIITREKEESMASCRGKEGNMVSSKTQEVMKTKCMV